MIVEKLNSFGQESNLSQGLRGVKFLLLFPGPMGVLENSERRPVTWIVTTQSTKILLARVTTGCEGSKIEYLKRVKISSGQLQEGWMDLANYQFSFLKYNYWLSNGYSCTWKICTLSYIWESMCQLFFVFLWFILSFQCGLFITCRLGLLLFSNITGDGNFFPLFFSREIQLEFSNTNQKVLNLIY